MRVQNDLTVLGHPEICVVGDTASLFQNGEPLPGVGSRWRYSKGSNAGKLIHSRILGNPRPGPFRYFDKGSMAVVGKGFAVLQSGKVRLSGTVPWLTWAVVHLQFLAQSSLRVSVFLRWVWIFFTGQRGSRLIINHHASESLKKAADTCVTESASSK